MGSELTDPATRFRAVAVETRTCKDHGAYESRQMDFDPPVRPIDDKPIPQFLGPWWTKCPKCDAAMQLESDAHDAEIRGGITQRQHFVNMRLAAAGIPARFKDAQIWNWEHRADSQRKVWQWARDYAGSFEQAIESGRSAGFIGVPGTGKTHLAIGLLRHIVEKGGTGSYTTVMDMLGRIRATFDRDHSETEAKVIDELAGCDLLVIDEVGRSLDSNYELAQFFRVLDTRYRDLRPTLLVSNLSPAKFREFLGDAVVDRLREAGGAVLVFDWGSQRSSRRPPCEE